MRYPLILIASILLISAEFSSAQYFNTGEDPSSLKWMQIKTGRFTVIYPKSYEAGGLAYAKALDDAYLKLGSIYPEMKFKIPVIIHNLTTQSNGYVAWAPKRMEIYPTPAQNTIPLGNETQLAIHELTHVLQMESLNKGFTKGLSFLLGEQTTGIVAGLLPLWFFEGEAVFAESYLSESGRGRIPSFQKQLKAIAVEKQGMYKYDKVLNGSFKDFIPDHYQSGYQMVTWAITKYNPQVWGRVLSYTGRRPFTLNPSNLSLSENYGLTKKRLFQETFDSLKTIWTSDVNQDNTSNYETINPDKNGEYINYYSPVYAGRDSIIALKTSLGATTSIVLINSVEKSEKRIHNPGYLYPWFLSFGNGKLVWVESQPDPRWQNRDYSVIKLMNLKTRKITRLSQRSRYMAASISSDGRMIAAVENTTSNINNLVIIEPETGVIIHSVKAPGNVYLQRPQWSKQNDYLTVIYLTEEGEGIMSYSLKNQIWQPLVKAGRDDIQSTFISNDSLFFISSKSGTENLYLQTSGKKPQRLTRSRFGATDIYIEEDRVYFSDYTSLGNNISVTRLGDFKDSEKRFSSTESFLINRLDNNSQTSDNNSVIEYKSEPYRKWKHLFKFHSWMPFYADIEEIKSDPASIRPGASIMTQNYLSTLISTVGYEYTSEKQHVLHTRVTWKGWYPVIESRLDFGNNPYILKAGETVNNPSEIKSGLSFSNAVSVPLHFSSGTFMQYIRPSFTTNYRNDYIYIQEEGSYDYGQTILSGRLYFSNFRRTAKRDLYPRLAQTFDLNYYFTPTDRKIYGTALTLKTSLYFPGIFPNNSIKLRFEKEKQVPSKFLYGNSASLPRGYKYIHSQDLELFSADYFFPLAYPDLSLSTLLYMKRIRAGLFYDLCRGTGNTYYLSTSDGLLSDTFVSGEETFISSGFELLADFHILRIPFLISAGIQSAWIKGSESPALKILFNIDLFGMTLGNSKL